MGVSLDGKQEPSFMLMDGKSKMEMIKSQSLNSRETFENRVQRYVSALTVPVERLRLMSESFTDELYKGLEAHKAHPNEWIPSECSFKMVDACIRNLPDGKEKGVFYALDFGGTNFRGVRCELTGDGRLDVRQRQESLMSATLRNPTACPKGLMDPKASATEMFDFFAQVIRRAMEEQGDLSRKNIVCGFTFSFPCAQRVIDSSVLMTWTKGFETGRATNDPVEGLDVAELMNVAFKRHELPIVCNSVVNDTVGTLLSCSYEMDHSLYPPCLVGLILGTGSNCCYFEPTAAEYGYKGNIINIECGNFNRDLPRTNVDCELDFHAVDNRGYQQLEKLTSGAYLGEIARGTLVKIFQHRAPPLAWEAGSLSTEVLAKILGDKSKELIITKKIILEEWEVEMPLEDLWVVHTIATLVMDRSAMMAAVMIAGCARKTGRLLPAFGGLSVAIDGSLYKKNAWYKERVRHHLDGILGARLSSLIHLLSADDGSGKGAGILAATIASKR